MRKQVIETEIAAENLGLDADGSSEGNSLKNRLNDDNDRITGNPAGENDTKEDDDHTVSTSLEEK